MALSVHRALQGLTAALGMHRKCIPRGSKALRALICLSIGSLLAHSLIHYALGHTGLLSVSTENDLP